MSQFKNNTEIHIDKNKLAITHELLITFYFIKYCGQRLKPAYKINRNWVTFSIN